MIAAALSLSACTTPDMACGMRGDYEQNGHAEYAGTVTIRWVFGAEDIPAGRLGQTECFGTDRGRMCLLRLRGKPPGLNDVCALAVLGHEVTHAMGGVHE